MKEAEMFDSKDLFFFILVMCAVGCVFCYDIKNFRSANVSFLFLDMQQ
jgi:hypothetical protein